MKVSELFEAKRQYGVTEFPTFYGFCLNAGIDEDDIDDVIDSSYDQDTSVFELSPYVKKAIKKLSLKDPVAKEKALKVIRDAAKFTITGQGRGRKKAERLLDKFADDAYAHLVKYNELLEEGRAEKKGEAVAQLMRDYKNAMAWVNAPKSEVPNHERSKWEQQAQKLRAHALKQYGMSLGESVAEPFKKFTKGQIVKVKKTGEQVEVMSQNDIGLVFTASKDALKVPADKKIKIVPGKGYQEYMPRELEEGWKMGAAAVALSAAVVAGIANSPKVEINGETYNKAGSLRSAPAEAKTATVTINGKKTKVLYWTAMGTKHNHKNRVYAAAE